MPGIKRKPLTPYKNHVGVTTTKTKQSDSQIKRRKITPQPASPSSDSDADSDETNSDSSEGGVKVFSEEEEAVIYGPNAQERGEAETDSDPIVESDTTEHSGDDDGVSWPSDDEEPEPPNRKAAEKTKKEDHTSSTGKDKPVRTSADGKTKDEATTATIPSKGATSSSRESHAKQKAMAQERKAAKPNADSIARTKKLWERLRRKSHVPKDERKQLVAELFEIITGHIKDFVLKHDSVRVVQTALKYASPDQRRMIAFELKGEYRGLAESRYAKFLIGKLLIHGDKEIRDTVVPEMYGHVRRMIKHPEASWILDDVYRGVATPTQKAILLREWYGAEFAIFKINEKDRVAADLAAILANQPEKRKPIIHALHDLINQCIQKKTTGFTMLHDAMLQYYLNLQQGSSEALEFVELLTGDEAGDLLKNLAFTKSGARIVCLALAYSNAKDRKLILRTFKDTIQAMSYDRHGHQVLLTAYDVIDDTVLTTKTIFPELLGKDHNSEESQRNLLHAAVDPTGRIPILYPFNGLVKSLLSNEDQKLLNEIHPIRKETSKKDPEVRRKELVTSLSPPLLSFIEKNAQDLMTSAFGCQFMNDVLISSNNDRKPALVSIAGLAADAPVGASGTHSSFVGRMLKSLVQGGRYNQKTKKLDLSDPPLGFSDILYPKIQDRAVEWAASENSFVILALLEAKDFSSTSSLKKSLVKGKSQIATAAGSGNRGSQLLLEQLL